MLKQILFLLLFGCAAATTAQGCFKFDANQTFNAGQLSTTFNPQVLMRPVHQTIQTLYLPQDMNVSDVQAAEKEIAWNAYNTLYVREHNKALLYSLACAKHPLITASLLGRLGFGYATRTQNSIRKAIEGMDKLPKFTAAEGYLQWFKSCREFGLATLGQEAAVASKPIPGMQELVQEIANQGIAQRIATNNSLRIQKMLAQNLEDKYNDATFNFITIGKTVDYSAFGPEKDITTDLSQVTLARMPQQEYFDAYSQTYNPDNSKIIIHIAESREIIAEAVKYGWICIYFDATNPECSIEQLRADLANLGIIQ
jgi:hypothetical protein